MTSVRRIVACLVAAALLLGASACSDDGSSSRAADRTVTLLTYSGYALPEEAAAAFTKRTGWKVKVVDAGDAGSMLSAAILTAGQPEGDVLFGVDTTFLSRAQESTAFERYEPPSLDQVRDDLQPDPSGRFTPIDEGSVCVNADAQWLTGRGIPLPGDLESLTRPEYRDLLVVEHPAQSSPGLAFLVATRAVFGEGADDYWRRLRANGVAVAGSWDDAYNNRYTVNGGDRPLVVSYASSPPAEVVYSDGTRTEPASVVLTRTCFRQVEYAAVLAGTPHRDGARLLVEEMLSPAWQSALPLSNFVYPARDGVELPIEFRQWAAPVEDPLTLDPAEIGEHRDDWLAAWRDVME